MRRPNILIFMQTAGGIATYIYYRGIDPFTKQPVYMARNLCGRKLQRALMQFFEVEHYFEVHKVLEQAGSQVLIGSGCDARIPAWPPKEATRARREQGNRNFRGEYVHRIPNAGPNRGYRPGRKTARRRMRLARIDRPNQ